MTKWKGDISLPVNDIGELRELATVFNETAKINGDQLDVDIEVTDEQLDAMDDKWGRWVWSLSPKERE